MSYSEELREVHGTLKKVFERFDHIENMLSPLDNEKIGLVEQTRKNKEDIEELKKAPSKIKSNVQFAITVILFIIAVLSWVFK
jgi:archaellum component FlaC